MDETFTCKDFRTWAGSVAALRLMAGTISPDCNADCQKNIIAIVDGVAACPGNLHSFCNQ